MATNPQHLKGEKPAAIKRSASILATLALALGGLLGVGAYNASTATAAWPDAGKPGTLQGRVYKDYNGLATSVEAFNPQVDKPIAGVTLNAYVVKKNGQLISEFDENGLPIPFSVKTDAEGYYSFNFKPAMEKACESSGCASKIEKYDMVRVWPDESNYAAGQPLAGLTPKRINGGARYTKIETLNLSWLGMVNYVHGSASDVNMAFRPQTKKVSNPTDFGFTEPGTKQVIGNHLTEAQWIPTSSHVGPRLGPLTLPSSYQQDTPFLCGFVYSDTTFRYDRWDNGGKTDASAAPDKVVPGVRVAVSTYKLDNKNNPLEIIQTRYDYTDEDGRWCIKWDSPDQVKNPESKSYPRFNVTIDAPDNPDVAAAQIQALKDKTKSTAYTVTPMLAEDNGSGLPEGYSSVGLNAWYGGILPVAGGWEGVGYMGADLGCVTRGANCFPYLYHNNTRSGAIGADAAEMGLIPTAAQAKYSRISQDYGTDRQVKVYLSGAALSDNDHRVVMVPLGSDPFDPANHIATSALITGNTVGNLTVPGDTAVGAYSLYLLSTDDKGKFYMEDGKIRPGSLADVDNYYVNDTAGHYYQSQEEQTTAYGAEKPAASVEVVKPGTTLYNAYSDMALNNHIVKLVPRGAAITSDEVKDPTLVGDGSDNFYKRTYRAKDSFQIPDTQEPGDYDLVVVREVPIYEQDGSVSYSQEEVDRKPLTVSGPVLELSKNPVKPEEEGLSATIKDLNPDGHYQLVYTDSAGNNVKTVNLTAGVTTATVELTASKVKGLGHVKLIRTDKDNRVETSKPLLVSDKPAYGPEITLPGVYDKDPNHDGFVTSSTDWCGGKTGAELTTCLNNYHLDKDARVLYLQAFHTGNDSANIHAIEATTGAYIPGGENVPGYTWTISNPIKSYTWVKNPTEPTAEASIENKTIGWKDGVPSTFELQKLPSAQYVVVDFKVTNDSNGLSDKKQVVFIFYNGGQDTYAADWQSTAGVFTVGKKIPENTYCLHYAKASEYKEVKFEKSSTADAAYPWPQGITINSNGCLEGTPKTITPGEKYVNTYAKVTLKKGLIPTTYDQMGGGGLETTWPAPPTIRIAVREPADTEAPTITPMEVKDGAEIEIPADGTVEVQQGQALPLKIYSEDNQRHDMLMVNADKLPKGITQIPNGSQVGDDPKELLSDATSLTVAEDAEPGIYPITIMAMDNAENMTEKTINIKVTKKKTPPTFTDDDSATRMPDGKVGDAYNSANGWIVPVDGSPTAPIKSVEAEGLPKGMKITTAMDDSSGQNKRVFKVVGTPEEPVTNKPITFTVTNSDGDTVTKTYNLTVTDTPAPVWPPEPTVLTYELGKEITPTQLQATNCSPEYSSVKQLPSTATDLEQAAAGPMPDGLTYDNGTITGTPTTVDKEGTNYVLTATCGTKSAQKIVKIKVLDKTPPRVTTPPDQTIRDGEGLEVPIDVVDDGDSNPTTTVECKDGNTVLPTTFENGKLTVKPADSQVPGNYVCTVTSTDQEGNKTTEEFPVTVTGDPDATKSTLETFQGGERTPDTGVTAGSTVQVVYTPKDANGNVTKVPGPVKVQVPKPGGGTEEVTLTEGTGENAGKWLGNITPKVAGDNSLTSTVKPNANDEAIAGPTATLKVTAADPASKLDGSDDNASKLVLEPENANTGATVTVKGQVKDKYGNPVPNHQVTINTPKGTTTVTTDQNGKFGEDHDNPITYQAGKPGSTDTTTLYDGPNTTGTVLDTKSLNPSAKNVPSPTVDTANKDGIKGGTDKDKLPEGSTVTVNVPGGGPDGQDCQLTGQTDANGKFDIKWTEQCKPGDDTTVSVTVTDPDTNTPSNPTKIVPDMNVPPTPAIDPTNGTTIGGSVTATEENKLPADATVTVTIGQGDDAKVIKDIQIKDGKWTVPAAQIPSDLPDGTPIQAKVVVPKGNESEVANGAIDKTPTQAPVLDKNSDNKVGPDQVTGSVPGFDATTDKGAKVIVTYTGNDNTTKTAQATVGDNGKFTVKIEPPAKDKTTITAKVVDPAGNSSSNSNTVTVDASEPAPTLNDLGKDKTATGTTVNPNTTVIIYGPDGTELGRGTSDQDGNFSIKINGELPPHDSAITAVAVDEFKNESLPGKAKVDTQAPPAPTVNPTNGEAISGKATDASKVIVKIAGVTDPIEVDVDGNGDWSVPAEKIKELFPQTKKIPDGTKITATAKDSANNTSATDGTATVDGNASLTIDDKKKLVQPNTEGQPTKITGTTDPALLIGEGPGKTKSTVEVYKKKNAAGQPASGPAGGTVEVTEDGKWTFTPSAALADGTYCAKATDPLGNKSIEQCFVVDGTAPNPPTVPATNDGKTVTGTAEKGAEAVVIKKADGTELCTAEVDASGTFTVDLKTCNGGKELPPDTQLEIKVRDKAGNESTATTTTSKNGIPFISVEKSNGQVIKGKTDQPNAQVVIKYTPKDGTEKTHTVQTDSGGNFTFDIPAEDGLGITSPEFKDHGNTFTVKVTNPTSPDKTNTVTGVFSFKPITAPTVEPSNGKTVTGTGEPGTQITVTDKDGVKHGPVTVNDKGTWTLTPDNELPEGPITVVAKDPAETGYPNGFREPTAPVKGNVDKTVPQITVPSKNNGSTVTVTNVSSDIKCADNVAVTKNGVTVAGTWTQTDATCTFTPANPGDLAEGDTLVFTPTDPAGNSGTPVSSVVDKTPPSVTIDNQGGKVNGLGPVVAHTEPNLEVTMTYTDAEGNQQTVTKKADSNGNVNLPYEKGAPQDASTISVTAKDGVGNVTDPAATVTVDSAKPNQPSIVLDKAKPGHEPDRTSVTGKAEPGSTVKVCVKHEGSDPVCVETTADESTGDYTANFPASKLPGGIQDGDTVTATAKDKVGNVSDPTDQVADYTKPTAPQPQLNPEKPKEVTVQVTDDATKVKICVNRKAGGSECKNATVEDGKAKVDLTNDLATGDTVTVTTEDAAGNQSDPASKTVDFTKPPQPTVEYANGTGVKGKPGANSGDAVTKEGDTVTVRDGEGNIIGTGKVKKDPETNELYFDVPYSPGKAPTKSGVPITVTITDADGNESEAANGTTDCDGPKQPLVDDTKGRTGDKVKVHVSENDGKVTISYQDGDGNAVTKTVDVPAGAPTDAAGNYVVEITLDKDVKDGQDITVIHTDRAGNDSPAATGKVDRELTTLTVNKSNGSSFSGTTEPYATVTIPYTDESNVARTATAKADASGHFSTGKLEYPAKTGTFTATAKDEAGNTKTADAPVKRQAVAVTVNPTNGKEVTANVDLSKTPKEDITQITVKYCAKTGSRSATEPCQMTTKTFGPGEFTVDDEGKVKLSLSPAAANGSDVTVTVTDKLGNSGDDTTQADGIAPGAPTVDEVSADKVKGHAGDGTSEGDTVVVKNSAGEVIGQGTVNADKEFEITFDDDKKPADGETISVYVTDPAGNTSDPGKGTVDASPHVNPKVAPSGTQVTGTADPGSTIVIRLDGEGNPIGTGVADENGNFTIDIRQLRDGDKVKVTATDPAGNTETKEITYNAPAPANPSVDNWDEDGNVTGKADPGATVTVCVAGGQCFETTADGQGVFRLNIPGLKPGDKLTVKATDPDTGAVSGTTNFTVPAESKPGVSNPALSTTGAATLSLSLVAGSLLLAGLMSLGVKRRREE